MTVTRVFISYRSRDANLVRAVVDRLRACHVEVWFAELDVLSHDYEDFDEHLDERLTAAVDGCTHALVFSNDAWSESSHCQGEMRRILEHVQDRARIVEVRCPEQPGPHRVFPALAAVPWLGFVGETARPDQAEIHRLTREIGQLWGIPTDPGVLLLPDPDPRRIGIDGFGLTFAPGPLELRLANTAALGGLSSNDALCLGGAFGGSEVSVFLFGSVTQSVLGWESEAHDPALADGGDDVEAADRKLYQSYRESARAWYADPGTRGPKRSPTRLAADYTHMIERGLHLMFVDGRSLPCLTYTFGQAPAEEVWERRVLLPVRRADRGALGEVNLVFRVRSPGTPAERAARFWALCAQFDRVVHSIRFDPAFARPSWDLLGPALLARVAWIAGIGAGLHALLRSTPRWWGVVLLGAALGWLVGEAASLLGSRAYQRLMIQESRAMRDRVRRTPPLADGGGGPAPEAPTAPDVIARSAPEIWSVELTRVLFGQPIVALNQVRRLPGAPLLLVVCVTLVAAVIAVVSWQSLSAPWIAVASAVPGLALALLMTSAYHRGQASRGRKRRDPDRQST